MGHCHHLWEAPGWRSVAKGFDDDDYAAGVDDDEDDDCDVGQVGEEIVWDSCHLNVTTIIKNQSAMEKLRLKETSILPQHQHQHQHHNGNLNQTCGAEEQGQLGAALSEAILSVSSPPRRYGHHHRHRRQGLNCNPQIFEGEEFKKRRES